MDQQVLVEGSDLARCLLEQPDVVVHIGQPVQGHAAQQPPLDRRELVVAEVDATRGTKQIENAPELIVTHAEFVAASHHQLADIRMLRRSA